MKNFKAHILIVDDDDGIRELVKQYLDQNNYLVSTANSAEDALEKVKIIKFDLIVLDIMMPGKSGLEFTSIKIDLNKLFIYRENESLKINNTEKIILEKMINSPGKIFKRDEIGNFIDLDKERSIDVIITRLRKKIEENPKSPKYLQTIRGEGYVLWIE